MSKLLQKRLAALEAVVGGQPVYLVRFDDEPPAYVLPGEGAVARERWEAEQRRRRRPIREIVVSYDEEGQDARP